MDGVRGCAALMVLFGHCWFNVGMPKLDNGILLAAIASSSTGVDVFFVLSGFVLFLPQLSDRGGSTPRSFFGRRALRLLPLYWAMVALAGALVVVRDDVNLDVAGSIAAHLLFVQLPLAGLGWDVGLPGLGIAWTLSVEVAFYAMLPFIGRAFARRPALWTASALALTFAWRALAMATLEPGAANRGAGALATRLAMQPPMFAAHFALGMAAAVIVTRLRPVGNPQVARAARWVAVGGVMAFAAMEQRAGRRALAGAGETIRFADALPIAVSAALLIIGLALSNGRLQRALASAPLIRLGTYSYTIYLVHFPIILCLEGVGLVRADGSLSALTRLALLTLGGSIGVAHIVERTIDGPLRARFVPSTPSAAGLSPKKGHSSVAI